MRRTSSRNGPEEVVATLNHHLERHALGWKDFLLAWREYRRQRKGSPTREQRARRLEAAARIAILDGQVPADLAALREVVADASKLLNVAIPLSPLDSMANRIARLLRACFSALLFVFVSYMVLGGLTTNKTLLLGETDPVRPFAVLALLLLVLGAFEALHVGVTTLRLKDLAGLATRYPRANREHQKFREAVQTNRFLAGRQLVVVLVVFFAARLTSFPDMETWPFTGHPFPPWMSPWFENVFLNLGVLGAFFVLWTGQLLPQFVTTKNPAAILNIPGMNLVLDASFLIQSIGVTRPAAWLAAWYPEGPHIFTSAEETYRVEVESTQGYGLIGIIKNWCVGANGATLNYQNAIVFKRSDIQAITDRSLVVSGDAVRLSINHELIPDERSSTRRELLVEVGPEEREGSSLEWTHVTHTLGPIRGPFDEDDVLVNSAEIEFARCASDKIIVWGPTRFVLFRARFEDDPQIDDVSVEIHNGDGFATGRLPVRCPIPLREDEDGVPVAEFFELYPAVNTSYLFSWKVHYPERAELREVELTVS